MKGQKFKTGQEIKEIISYGWFIFQITGGTNLHV